jgi:hypothetical protein
VLGYNKVGGRAPDALEATIRPSGAIPTRGLRAPKSRNWESRKQVRSVKVCAAGGESPPSSAARLPEFRMKVMNGKV